MSATFSVSIVLPNWNGEELLAKYLPHVLAIHGVTEVIVSDDASDDGSVAFLKKNFPKVKIVEKKFRDGFASNINAGVAAATGDVIVLLNTDVRPEKGFLNPLIQHFSDPAVFAVGCMDRSHEGKRIELRGRGEAAWIKGFFVHRRGAVNRSTTAWVNGGSGAYRRAYWQKLGGMDTFFDPFYWEDIDISYRALKAGYRLVFEPKSIVDHFHEEGKIKKIFSEKQVKQIAYRNQFIFNWKNVTDWNILFQHFCFLPIRLAQAVLSGEMMMVMGFWNALLLLPKILEKRQKEKGLYKISDQDVQLK